MNHHLVTFTNNQVACLAGVERLMKRKEDVIVAAKLTIDYIVRALKIYIYMALLH
jgi:hypothetical protein